MNPPPTTVNAADIGVALAEIGKKASQAAVDKAAGGRNGMVARKARSEAAARKQRK